MLLGLLGVHALLPSSLVLQPGYLSADCLQFQVYLLDCQLHLLCASYCHFLGLPPQQRNLLLEVLLLLAFDRVFGRSLVGLVVKRQQVLKMAELCPAVQLVELELTLYLLHQSRNYSRFEAVHKIALRLTNNLRSLALRCSGIVHIPLLDPFKALLDQLLLPVPHLLNLFLYSREGELVALDLVDDLLIDVFVVVIDAGVDGVSLGLYLKIQVVDLSDEGVESLSVEVDLCSVLPELGEVIGVLQQVLQLLVLGEHAGYVGFQHLELDLRMLALQFGLC